MGHRTLALLGLLAALTFAGFLLQNRERSVAPREAGAPTTKAEVERTVELVPVALGPAGERSPRPVSSRGGEPAPEVSPREAVDSLLVFHARDEAGRAVLGKLTVATRIRSSSGARSSAQLLPTEGDGRFEVRVAPSFPGGYRRELEVSARERNLTAHVDLSRSFPPGRTDMGELFLTPAPLIAEGRVIDASGRPVARAWVNAGTLASRDLDRELENEPYSGRGRTDERGGFALYGNTNVARMRIRLQHERLRAASLELPVGSRGIEIVAQEGGGVVGRVLVDPAIPVGALQVILRPESAPTGTTMESPEALVGSIFSDHDDANGGVAGDGRFRLERLLPCSYTLSIEAGGDALVEIPGIEIVSGEINRDPRLQAIDLCGRLRAFTLELLSPSHALQLSGTVSYREARTRAPLRRLYFSQSPVLVVTPLAAIDVVVRARDCRIERLAALAERTEVRLRPALEVRLVLPGGLVLPPPPLFVGASLEDADPQRSDERPRGQAESRATTAFDEHGESLCLAHETGPMRVRWLLEHRESGNCWSSSRLDMPFEQIVVVEEREGEQRIELTVTQQALNAALAAR